MTKLTNKKATLIAIVMAIGMVLASFSGAADLASANTVKVKDVSAKSTYHNDVQHVLKEGYMILSKDMNFFPN